MPGLLGVPQDSKQGGVAVADRHRANGTHLARFRAKVKQKRELKKKTPNRHLEPATGTLNTCNGTYRHTQILENKIRNGTRHPPAKRVGKKIHSSGTLLPLHTTRSRTIRFLSTYHNC